MVVDFRFHVPDAVPAHVGVMVLGDPAINQRARRVRGEVVTVAAVVEGVEQNFYAVVRVHESIPVHVGGHDLFRGTVKAANGDVQGVLVVGYPDPCGFGRWLSGMRLGLDELSNARMIAPDVIIEQAIYFHALHHPNSGGLPGIPGPADGGDQQQDRDRERCASELVSHQSRPQRRSS